MENNLSFKKNEPQQQLDSRPFQYNGFNLSNNQILDYNRNLFNFQSQLNDFSYNPMKIQTIDYYNNYQSNKFQKIQKEATPSSELFEIQKKRKKQKYKRSTNNSHKKFISAIRRLFFAVISTKQKDDFQNKYFQYKSCRTFFFIILAYMKYRFSPKLLNSVKVSFINEMKIKINEYQEEINRTKNINLKNFRQEQIIDIKYSIKSCNQYFNGNSREAIQCMYKKDKSTVVKRQHYESALRSVHMIQKQLSENHFGLLQQPYVQDYSFSSQKQKIQKKVFRREIRENQNLKFALQNEQQINYPTIYQNDAILKNKLLQPTKDTVRNQVNKDQALHNIDRKTQFLYPPLLQTIPFVKYNPFFPPFLQKRQKKHNFDVRQDFLGYINYGFPKFRQ